MREYAFEESSALAIPASQFWADATLADVNAELAPWVRMTAPAAWELVPLRQWPTGQCLFRSWVLLLGFLPVDLHAFYLQSIDPGRGFEERSSSVTNKRWEHSRAIASHNAGCLVVDSVRFESRLPLVGAMLLPVYRAIFRSRHRYLRRKHGQPVG